MAYQTGDNILDTHYNDFGTSVNALWGTGTGDAGYGESTTVSTVSDGDTITAAQWSTVLSRITSIKDHQSSSVTAITSPSTGDLIEAFTALSTNISTITTNRLNVHARQSAVNNNIDNTSNFTGTITQTGRFAWGSANQARYFFNAGGRLSCSWSLSGHTSDNKANNWAALATACGTFQITAQSSGKSGGSGSTSTNDTNAGFYDLGTSFAVVFKQFEDDSPYTASFIQLSAQTASSATQVELKSEWSDAAADQTSFNKSIYNVQDIVDGTKRSTMSSEKHNTTHVSDNGGTITFSTVTNSHS